MKQALELADSNREGNSQPALFPDAELPHMFFGRARANPAPAPGGRSLRFPHLNEDGAVQPVAVLKFGHSVLQSVDHVSVACNEIYRRLREGYKVVAVVSAIGNETSELLKISDDLFFEPNSRALPKL